MASPLVHNLGYDKLTEYGDNLLKGDAPTVLGVDASTQLYLNQLKAVDGKNSEPANPLSTAEYQAEVGRLREATSSGPSIVTPAMVKKIPGR
mmetsp:Transcript_53808/g.161034  ORF Transcript_53808/g.161034 Transcript_53808/m.161034 type:complete len:92 (-) Transcript_53808:2763-3038(-)